jgi:hypothetical protein
MRTATPPDALTVARSFNHQLTILEIATWNKRQKLSLAA